MTKLIVGCGYLGSRVARLWLAAGEHVVAMTRSASRAEVLRRQGLAPFIADVTNPPTLAGLPAADTVLIAIGHDRHGGVPIEKVYVDGLRNLLSALPGEVERIIYISSTGVYGNQAGQRVDESTLCTPDRAGGRAHLAAEQVLAASAWGDRSVVLRLAGIYGPGRVPNSELLLAGKELPVATNGYLNLIHVDDAANVVLAACGKHVPMPRLYVVSDGSPCPRGNYYRELARLLKASPPHFADVPPGTPNAKRAADNKQVDNRRMREELNVRLLYPSYREGLSAIVQGPEAEARESEL